MLHARFSTLRHKLAYTPIYAASNTRTSTANMDSGTLLRRGDITPQLTRRSRAPAWSPGINAATQGSAVLPGRGRDSATSQRCIQVGYVVTRPFVNGGTNIGLGMSRLKWGFVRSTTSYQTNLWIIEALGGDLLRHQPVCLRSWRLAT